MNPEIVIGLVSRLLPISVLGLIGYSLYAYSYVYSYKTVYLRHGRHGVSIALIVLFSFFSFLVLVDWFLILVVGPGKVTKTRPYILNNETQNNNDPNNNNDNLNTSSNNTNAHATTNANNNTNTIFNTNTDACDLEQGLDYNPNTPVKPPPAFMSDPSGYPLWCSTCQQLKPDRVHHSAELGYCVDKMDHLCNWLGAVIGRQNYRYFILLQVHFLCAITLVFTSVPVYFRDMFRPRYAGGSSGGDRAHMIVLFAISGLWMAILVPFLLTHIKYTMNNTTTLELLKYHGSNAMRPIFNIELPKNVGVVGQAGNNYENNNEPPKRIVSRIRLGDPNPYDRGSRWLNWCESMSSNPILWVLPFPSARALRCLKHFLFNRHSQQQQLPQGGKSQSRRNVVLNEKASLIPNYSTSNDYYTPENIFVNPKFIQLAVERFMNNEEGYYAYPHLQNLPQEGGPSDANGSNNGNGNSNNNNGGSGNSANGGTRNGIDTRNIRNVNEESIEQASTIESPQTLVGGTRFAQQQQHHHQQQQQPMLYAENSNSSRTENDIGDTSDDVRDITNPSRGSTYHNGYNNNSNDDGYNNGYENNKNKNKDSNNSNTNKGYNDSYDYNYNDNIQTTPETQFTNSPPNSPELPNSPNTLNSPTYTTLGKNNTNNSNSIEMSPSIDRSNSINRSNIVNRSNSNNRSSSINRLYSVRTRFDDEKRPSLDKSSVDHNSYSLGRTVSPVSLVNCDEDYDQRGKDVNNASSISKVVRNKSGRDGKGSVGHAENVEHNSINSNPQTLDSNVSKSYDRNNNSATANPTIQGFNRLSNRSRDTEIGTQHIDTIVESGTGKLMLAEPMFDQNTLGEDMFNDHGFGSSTRVDAFEENFDNLNNLNNLYNLSSFEDFGKFDHFENTQHSHNSRNPQ